MFRKVFRKLRRDNRGFSLAELMVVIVIIGVLTAIAIPVYNVSKSKAEAGACKANRRMIDSAIEQFKMLEDGEINEGDQLKEKLGKYFSGDFPKCPTNGDYTYENGHATCGNDEHDYRTSKDSGGNGGGEG